ncbi:hypothetical protein A7D27_01250 [Pseudomonas sp. 1D4]|uniref:hypothetical protein n=1 Tax=Pseudomonadaceae TaxID=135621 RepID=UPI00084B221B|nr:MULTISPECIES: hypothetical protein [Pseudomonas]OEC47125.1 hypothetical protein A7D27_01250 [Pseudomonas sp. 1D4]OEC59243.1 hypothetical protein A9G05_12830 [Pseudomonas sp. ENNP23]
MSEIQQNPYSAPRSELVERPPAVDVPSIEEALARGYDFRIGELISEGWQRIQGLKGMIIGGLLVYSVVSQLVSFILGLVLGLLVASDGMLLMIGQLVIGIIAGACAAPVMAGLYMLAMRQVTGQPLNFNEVFAHTGKFVPLAILSLLLPLMVYLGFLLLVIPGIYLSIAYALAMPLMVERGLSPWQAMEASRRAISQRWFKCFGLFALLGLIVMLSALPLFVGLVWTLPMCFVVVALLYQRIFGIQQFPQ